MMKSKSVAGVLLSAALVLGQISAIYAADTKLKKSQLPAAVQKAADEATKGSQVLGYAKEVEGGKTFYEVETKVNGKTRDMTFDEQGNTIAVEEEVAITSLPSTVQDGLRKAAGKGHITKVESITKGSIVTYEAAVKGGSKKEIEVDNKGVLVSQ
jgi:uncharacterized membrane protein YkoI